MTGEQLRIASKIDTAMLALAQTGKDNLAVVAEMAEHMTDFKWLMVNATPGDMDELCHRYAGFFQYAKILETVAAGFQSGTIAVPK